jgi:hypothetical protein
MFETLHRAATRLPELAAQAMPDGDYDLGAPARLHRYGGPGPGTKRGLVMERHA